MNCATSDARRASRVSGRSTGCCHFTHERHSKRGVAARSVELTCTGTCGRCPYRIGTRSSSSQPDAVPLPGEWTMSTASMEGHRLRRPLRGRRLASPRLRAGWPIAAHAEQLRQPLFDDVLWVQNAQRDHLDFMAKMKERRRGPRAPRPPRDLLADRRPGLAPRRKVVANEVGLGAVEETVRSWTASTPGPWPSS